MNQLVQIAGVGFAILGIAYVTLPRKIYYIGLESLRDTQSESTEPSTFLLYVYRFIGVCLIVMGISYLF